jgi:DNA-binding NtrC family response regulator
MTASNILVIDDGTTLHNLLQKIVLPEGYRVLEATMSQGQPIPAFDLSSVEKLHIQRVLNYTRGNKVEAARLLNIGLTTVYRKIEEYGLE